MRSKHSQEVAVPDRVLCTYNFRGMVCPVTNMFDVDGDATEDDWMACSVVIQLPNGGFIAVATTDGEGNNFQCLS